MCKAFERTAARLAGQDGLRKAARKGFDDVVRFWVDKGVDVNAKDKEGMTALHMAAWGVAQELKEDGIHGNVTHYDFVPPELYSATVIGCVKAVRVLLENGADVNAKGGEGETPLHKAAQWRFLEVLEILLENKADVNAKDNLGNTALHWAAGNGYSHITTVLLDNGADVNAENLDGNTALTLALARGDGEDMVKVLVKNGAKDRTT